jgi:hypothetical protein
MASAEIVNKLWTICRNHHGQYEVWLHVDNGVELLQLRVAEAFWVDPTPEFCDAILDVLGDGHLLVPRPVG